MTISDVRGFSLEGGSVDTYRGVEYRVDYVPKVKIEMVVNESFIEATIDAIIETARTDNVGDGKIWIEEVGEVIRVRIGEKDGVTLN